MNFIGSHISEVSVPKHLCIDILDFLEKVYSSKIWIIREIFGLLNLCC